jgi:hypothetical protein
MSTKALDLTPEALAPPPPAGRRVLATVAIVVILGLGIGLVLAARGGPAYPEGSAEAAAQGYLQALFDEDPAQAREFLAPELAATCQTFEPASWWISESRAARFEDVRELDGTVVIDLELSSLRTYDPFEFPLDDYDPVRDTELVLEQRNGTWVITEAAWPLHQCDRRYQP